MPQPTAHRTEDSADHLLPAGNTTQHFAPRTENVADHKLAAGHSRARNTLKASTSAGRRDLKTISTILSIPVRWQILYIFAREELVSVTALAGKVGMSRPATSMHLRVLKDAGLIESTIGRLYRLAPALRPAPGVEYLDLGLCRLLLPPAP